MFEFRYLPLRHKLIMCIFSVNPSNEKFSLESVMKDRLQNITRLQRVFVQENMNELHTRRSDTNTPIA